MATNNYYNALLMCIDEENERSPWMNAPFEVNNFACATEGHLMLIFDKKLVEGQKLGVTPSHDVIEVIPQMMNKNFNIKISLLEEAISKTPLIEEIIETETECKECDGDGEVMCDYCGFEHTCENCKGEGMIYTSTPTGKMIPDESNIIVISNSNFSVKMLLKMVEIAKELLQEEIILAYQVNDVNVSVFKISEATLLLMPVISDKEPIFIIN